ncbi:cobalt ECF transporter T component CbiQ [Dendrosporobacter sp. 1207_IL3150]|uniref:cobalt ECF transporter T component CbiQ n=1 Tax=Dendrosporobacter sp. 1207_IL3150 TaxID=3084054 RepID=UPI002FDB5DE1
MLNIESNWLNMRLLDDLSMQNTLIHRIDPRIKILISLAFVIIVTSFSKYEITGLLPLFFYPITLMSIGNIPSTLLLKRLLIISPFILFVGVFNPIFDRTPLLDVGFISISGGWISFISITVKLTLTAAAALLLVATTGINPICAAMHRLGCPKPLVVQLSFMYRYLHVLLEEFIKTVTAYQLRSPNGKGVQYRAWGSLLGQLLLRTYARAKTIYDAMLCRGFDGRITLLYTKNLQNHDRIYLAYWLFFFILCRAVNIPKLMGKLLLGGL